MKKILLLFIFLNFALAQEYLIKVATIAPDGSTWINVLREYDAQIRKESNGRIGFKIYAGGVAGDEIDVLKKIRIGQYHAGGFTGVGIGEIAPNVRVLDSPFLFKNYDEVDHIYQKFSDELEKEIEKGGFVLLGWAEVGFVYTFTKTPVYGIEDLKKIKMWAWQGDPIAEVAYKVIGITPVPLSVTEVLTSLQTGLIDGVYGSPLAILATQWFTKVKYMHNVPITDASGALLISKKYFDSLPKDLQEILLRNGKKYMRKLVELTREENQKAIETLKKNGIIITNPPSKKLLEEYDEIGKKARRMLVGRLFSEEWLNKIEKALEEYRKANPKTSK
ncbi:TRAP-type C4-dicarboxylate transport system, substrate-binding protein [Candidatus Kryptonium thompsonii]|uniref:TRAP-type C4-dicarboxylate transport system, substrate-binding protein n=1 Tax=Candidatus Kryptonium thompsonii TaxID=1633631 RepID=A0A0P1LJ77_9BACT|nr:TRAP transporter substrate-binding protein DctP [Candidatus Kryptonium thompsoni]CUS78482.1 TRAP-type C4-dicarboxylate transport system, substrate-binding protein [Candidatus Kryptonium thompsoni]CUS81095.1 TRAP-type C4-dicarboxylate transport system, substrate-binding protein [Candidatus Kryptonium thompsoni]CUS81192.1 TRAP-type C4-dicarboxylate transport system, substrate-binding protein [Candidatus Kryptonium thompsoni]CUS81341.1 TRAP-type C4-dicarboxylate transport system, substrate-bind